MLNFPEMQFNVHRDANRSCLLFLICAGSGRFELRVFAPTNSAARESASGESSLVSAVHEPLKTHSWDAASEKATLHALVLKALRLGADESSDDSADESRAAMERASSQVGTSTSTSNISAGKCSCFYSGTARKLSCQGESACDQHEARNTAAAGSQQQPSRFWSDLCASLGLRDVSKHGWRRRKQELLHPRGSETNIEASIQAAERNPTEPWEGTRGAAAALLADGMHGPK